MAAAVTCEASVIDPATRKVVRRCPEPVVFEATRAMSGIKQQLCEAHGNGAKGPGVALRRIGGW